MTAAIASPRATRREWAGLAVLALPTLLLSIDIFVLLLALPKIDLALRPSSTQQLWISDSYSFLLAGFLVTMGTLGDRIGRRKLLLIGAAAFGAASVLAAYASSPVMLILARALLGIAGATLSPSTLALISTMFTSQRQRAAALGVWMACFMSGAAIGPLVGGLLLEYYWWGSVFLLAVPVMVLLLVAGPVLLPEYRSPDAGRIEPGSVALSLGAVIPAVYGLTSIARYGWQPLPGAWLVVSAVAGVLFVRRQRSLAEPLLDLGLLASRTFSAAMSGLTLSTMLTGAVMLLVTQYFQLVDQLSPVAAGVRLLPAAVSMAVSSLAAPRLARVIRPAYLITSGLIAAIAGLLLIAAAHAEGPVAVGWTVITLGSGPVVTLSVDLVLSAAPPARAGSAAALNETGSQLGFALGIAVLGSVAAAVYRSRVAGAILPQLPSRAAEEARGTLAGATAAAQHVPHPAGAALLHAARAAFTAGIDAVAVISALLLTGVALGVLVLLRHVPRSGPEHPSGHPDDQAEHPPGVPAHLSPSRASLGHAEADQEG
jgi:MFS transporter, DHA2 family, multidrug resistance protein